MARAFSTYRLINGKEPLLRRMVCEVTYQDGQLYLDHCGRLLKRLLKDAPEWIVNPDPTPQGAIVFNIVAGTQVAFSVNGASLTLDKSLADEVIQEDEAEEFCRQVSSVLALVIDELEVSDFLRIGYRELYYFPCDSKEESEQWIRDLGLFTIAPALFESFKAQPEALGVSLVLRGQECQYRIALNGIERSAQVPVGEASVNLRATMVRKGHKKALVEALKKQRQRQINSAFSVVLDMDAYQTDPVEPDLAGFVKECMSTNLNLFREALPKDAGKRRK